MCMIIVCYMHYQKNKENLHVFQVSLSPFKLHHSSTLTHSNNLYEQTSIMMDTGTVCVYILTGLGLKNDIG